MTLTAQDATKIAEALSDAAESTLVYLKANYKTMDQHEYDYLNESVSTLLNLSNHINTVAVGLHITQMQNPANQLQGVIAKTNEKIKVLTDIKRIILLVAALADLGAGVMAKDPGAVVAAVGKLNRLLA